ncbi:MAG: hypothetical protein V7752_15945 [Halopseudomonas sp.]
MEPVSEIAIFWALLQRCVQSGHKKLANVEDEVPKKTDYLSRSYLPLGCTKVF